MTDSGVQPGTDQVGATRADDPPYVALEPAPGVSTPDLYADAVAVGAGVYGFTLTFLLSPPMRPAGDSGLRGHPVAHIRVSPALAKALADSITQSLAILPEPMIKMEEG